MGQLRPPIPHATDRVQILGFQAIKRQMCGLLSAG